MKRPLRASSAHWLTVIVVYVVVMLCPFAGRSVLASVSVADDGPRAVIPITSFDFGDVYRGEIISYVFVIRNAGKSDLMVTEVLPTCGCEAVEWDRTVPPGKEGQVAVEVNTSTQSGVIAKIAIIKTSDPDLQSLTLTLNANVLTGSSGGPVEGVKLRQGKHVGPIFVGPDTRWGYRVPDSGKGTFEFTVSVEKGKVSLTKAETPSQNLKCRIEEVEAGKSYKVVVEPVSEGAMKPSDNLIKVSTDSAQIPWFNLHLRLIPSK